VVKRDRRNPYAAFLNRGGVKGENGYSRKDGEAAVQGPRGDGVGNNVEGSMEVNLFLERKYERGRRP